MARSETRVIDGVGPVLFEKSTRARRINITVRPFRGVRVAVPRGMSFARAEGFARSKRAWMARHLERMRARETAAEGAERFAPVDRTTARSILQARLEELSARHGLPYNRLFVRNQKTIWGSCSDKKNINLNMNLVRLPSRLMDYVIVHELVHTRIMNHGSRFWRELERCVPGAKKADRELKKYGLELK